MEAFTSLPSISPIGAHLFAPALLVNVLEPPADASPGVRVATGDANVVTVEIRMDQNKPPNLVVVIRDLSSKDPREAFPRPVVMVLVPAL